MSEGDLGRRCDGIRNHSVANGAGNVGGRFVGIGGCVVGVVACVGGGVVDVVGGSGCGESICGSGVSSSEGIGVSDLRSGGVGGNIVGVNNLLVCNVAVGVASRVCGLVVSGILRLSSVGDSLDGVGHGVALPTSFKKLLSTIGVLVVGGVSH